MAVKLRALLAAAIIAWAGIAAPVRAEWLRAESPNFIVYSEGSEATLRAYVEQLEEFDRLLRLLTGTRAEPSPSKLNIYFVRGNGQLNRIRAAGSASGFYSASPDGIIAAVDHGMRQDWMSHREILLHEYAHHFMLQYFPAGYPAWYIEGFAEYVSTARLAEDTIEVGRFNEVRASWLADRSGWLPLDRLLFSDPAELRGPEVAKFYAQSWLLVHYLLRDSARRDQLSRYLVAVGRGTAPRSAFNQTFGIDSSTLQRTISRYGSSGMTFTRFPRITAGAAPPVRIASLADASDDLLLVQAALTLTVTRDPDSVLRRARALADGRGDALARRMLARAEALYGDGAAADRLLDGLLAEVPNDAELLYLKGMRHLAAGRRDEAGRAAHFRQAQPWFARAHRADANHFPTLYRYAESLSAEPSFISENTANILLLAAQLAPQVGEIALTAANVLMRRGDFEQAQALLAPIASDPHGRALSRAARTLIDKARNRDAQGLPDPFDVPRDED